MALFLETAQTEQVKAAQKLGFVSGITTNPRIIQRSGRAGLDILEEFVGLFDGHVFYQLTAKELEARIDEAWQAYDLRPDRVVIKLPASTENLSLIKRLPEIDIAITAVFNPMQAYVAAESGAHYVLPYLNLANEMLGEGSVALVSQISNLIRNTQTQILAANIHHIDQALNAMQAGAHHVTLPFHLLTSVGNHPLSEQVANQTIQTEKTNDQTDH